MFKSCLLNEKKVSKRFFYSSDPSTFHVYYTVHLAMAASHSFLPSFLSRGNKRLMVASQILDVKKSSSKKRKNKFKELLPRNQRWIKTKKYKKDSLIKIKHILSRRLWLSGLSRRSNAFKARRREFESHLRNSRQKLIQIFNRLKLKIINKNL